MKAIVVEQAGGPEVLQIRDIPQPEPRAGWVLIKVKAFGLNRSEMFTRQGHSPSVKFPRVLGIECVGEVVAAPETALQPGQKVVALMGGMGRTFDGGYAEFTLVPAKNVFPVNTNSAWEILAALPETFGTAWGSLVEAMDVKAGQTLLVRGGTSSVGMAAITLAKGLGLNVIATTRNPDKETALRENGADIVLLDDGNIADKVKQQQLKVDAVLELVGATTLGDSLKAVSAKGVVCSSGILGNAWIIKDFEPAGFIPSTVKLTTFSSGDIVSNNPIWVEAMQKIVDGVAENRYRPNLDKIFHFEQIVEAHHYMEENQAKGKIVVLVD